METKRHMRHSVPLVRGIGPCWRWRAPAWTVVVVTTIFCSTIQPAAAGVQASWVHNPVGPAADPPLITDAYGYPSVPVTGDVTTVHDPMIVREKDTYHLFFTHGGIETRTSTDLVHWTAGPPVFDPIPAWVQQELPDNPGDLWAPDLSYWGGQWHLYYTASVWIAPIPTRNSAIGHATTPTLDRSDPAFGWSDHGPVVQSRGTFYPPTDTSGWNAIDPNVVIDEHGDPWLSWGSAFDGIFIQRLGADGALLPGSTPVDLARRGVWWAVVEASTVIHHDGAWWLFASYDICCKGVQSNYNVRVGRADAITGPYYDKQGRSLLSPRDVEPADDRKGEVVLEGYGDIIGPGHQTILEDGGHWWLGHHWYDPAANGQPRLGLRPLVWGADGWPAAAGVSVPSSTTTTTAAPTSTGSTTQPTAANSAAAAVIATPRFTG